MKNHSYSECKSLREECSKGEPSISKPKPFQKQPSQTKPPESKTNQLYDIAVTGDAPSGHLVQDDEESEATRPPKNTPPHPSIFIVDQTTLNLVATPEVDQTKPPSPPPSETDPTTLSEDLTQPQPDSTIQPPLVTLPEPEQQQQQNSEPNSAIIIHRSETSNEPLEQPLPHEVVDNTVTVNLPINHHFQEISRTLDMDHVEKSPPHTSDLNNLMDNLQKECISAEANPKDSDNLISVPKHLPAKILNQPISSTHDDIELLLKAINRNIRRLGNDVPNISIDSAHIAEECKLMKKDFILMIYAVEEAYTKALEFRKEVARLEAERLEKERLEKEKREAEERERNKLEDERIEKERQESLKREQARLAEEARIAAEKAKLAEFVQNAPEVAIKIREDQDDLRRTLNEHQQQNTDL
jgi:hypothetical protein